VAGQKQRRRERWFLVGAEAVRRAGLADSITSRMASMNQVIVDEAGEPVRDFYICPLCTRVMMMVHAQARDLTFEHAPPEALGGREVVLTCKDCNNGAGSRYDAQLSALERFIDFGQGTMTDSEKMRIRIQGNLLNADIHAVGDNIDVFVDYKRNSPDRHITFVELLSQLASGDSYDNVTLDLALPSFRFKDARMSLLRSAYLAAFAALGYTYIRHSELDLVRRQLLDPSQELIAFYAGTDPSKPRRGNFIMLTSEPKWLDSLVVTMGRHTVFLPGFEQPSGFYVRLAQHVDSSGKWAGSASGRRLAWPTSPKFAMDMREKGDAA
jgi:hypothetical protein